MAKQKRLIVNADDFGYNQAITDGIAEAHRDGIVTSTTLMANMPGAEYACRLAPSLPRLSIGIHFTLTQYKPLLPASEVPSLVGPDGRFLNSREAIRRSCRFGFAQRELEAELEAQVRFMLDRGVIPTHWDSHHYCCMYPQTQLAALRVGRRLGITRCRTGVMSYFVDRLAASQDDLRRRRLRLALASLHRRLYYIASHFVARHAFGMTVPDRLHRRDRMVTDVSDKNGVVMWRRLVGNVATGTSEMVCHPGLKHDDSEDTPAMAAQRVQELAILTDPSIRAAIEENGIQLISYFEL